MWTTVEPVGFRPDLQLVSGVQSDGKLYEWLSILARRSHLFSFSFSSSSSSSSCFQTAAQHSGIWGVGKETVKKKKKKKEESAPPGVREVYKGSWRREVTGRGHMATSLSSSSSSSSSSVIMWSLLRETEIGTEGRREERWMRKKRQE